MRSICKIGEYFGEVETREDHKGYICSVREAQSIVILGTFCGLRNVSQIHQWAESPRIKEFLSNHIGIKNIPCYYWLLCLLKIVEPKSLKECFVK